MGSYVTTVYANVSFGIISGDVSYYFQYIGQKSPDTPDFHINTTTGAITTSQVFNYNQLNYYSVSSTHSWWLPSSCREQAIRMMLQ